MKIQRFADVYDEMIEDVNKQKTRVQNDMDNLSIEKQNVLDTYEQNYQNQMNNYNDLMVQQQQNIDTWANTQKETQQKQTDYNLGLIEQEKQDTEKQTNAEIGNAYIDYQKGLNRYSGMSETLVSQGLAGTGFAKNQDIAMNITYQNRVSAAKTALTKANTDYNNQMQQALLNNDAALAQIALEQMERNYALALQGFEYKTNMENNRLSYIQGINDTYFSKTNTLQSRLDGYNNLVNTIKTEREDAKFKKQQLAQQLALEKQQMAWEREKFYQQLNSLNNYTDYTDNTQGTQNYEVNTPYYQGNYNKDALTNGKLDKNKVFNNGYQPNNVNGTKVQKTGYTVGQAFGEGQLIGKTGANLDNQNLWIAGNKYYIWDGSQNKYIDVSSMVGGSLKAATGGGGGTHF